jgi:hypothetical protein
VTFPGLETQKLVTTADASANKTTLAWEAAQQRGDQVNSTELAGRQSQAKRCARSHIHIGESMFKVF